MTTTALNILQATAHDDLLLIETLAVPPLYRSEGFAEDLFDDSDLDAGSPTSGRYTPWGRVGSWLTALPMAVTVLSAAASVLV